jgi:hypothetical protein
MTRRSFLRSAWECLNGRSAFGSGWDAERPGLHSHAERGNDQNLVFDPKGCNEIAMPVSGHPTALNIPRPTF